MKTGPAKEKSAVKHPVRKQKYALLILSAGLLFGMLASCACTSSGLVALPIRHVRVAMDNNYPPVIFLNEHGNEQGILVDPWVLWEKDTGVKVELSAIPWWDALKGMEKGFRVAGAIIVFLFICTLIVIGRAVHKRGEQRNRELKQALDDLQKSERRYREIFNATNEAIFIHAASGGRLLHVNESMLKMYGYESEDEMVSREFNDLFFDKPPYSGADAIKKIQLALGEGPQVFEWLAKKKCGETFWVEVSLQVSQIGGEGQVLAVVRDITKRKQVEQSLRERERQYRTLVEQIPAIVYIDDVSSGVRSIYVSPQVETILGFTPEQWLQKSPDIWYSLVQANDIEIVDAKYIRCAQSGEPFEAEYRMRSADGRLLWFHDQAVMLRDENGNPQFVNGVMQDITGRKKAEEEMRRRVMELEMLYESGLAINQFLDPKEIGQKVIELLGQKLDWHHTTIRLYHPHDESLELLAFNQPGLKNEDERREVAESFQYIDCPFGSGSQRLGGSTQTGGEVQ